MTDCLVIALTSQKDGTCGGLALKSATRNATCLIHAHSAICSSEESSFTKLIFWTVRNSDREHRGLEIVTGNTEAFLGLDS